MSLKYYMPTPYTKIVNNTEWTVGFYIGKSRRKWTAARVCNGVADQKADFTTLRNARQWCRANGAT